MAAEVDVDIEEIDEDSEGDEAGRNSITVVFMLACAPSESEPNPGLSYSWYDRMSMPTTTHYQTVPALLMHHIAAGRIKFCLPKHADMVISRRQYDCPKKYCEVWKMLLNQHLATGHLQESSSL
ncbi:hypothetical protein C8T65DRAFT_702780, partial [Cerioporus squamosus]